MHNVVNMNEFQGRHIGPREEDLPEMLRTIGVQSMEQLIDETVPPKIRMDSPPALPQAQTEYEYLTQLKTMADKNSFYKTYIGLGYYCSSNNVNRFCAEHG